MLRLGLRLGLIQPGLRKTPPAVDMNFVLHTLLEIHIFKATKFSSLKNLDVTDLQTFAIIWSQVISARHNKGMWFPKSPAHSEFESVLDFIPSFSKAKDMEEAILG